jgi:hypothetical protein
MFSTEPWRFRAFLVDRPPEVVHLTADLHHHLIQMPAPMFEPAHPRYTLPADISRNHRLKAAPPKAYCLMTEVDAALKQQILNFS